MNLYVWYIYSFKWLLNFTNIVMTVVSPYSDDEISNTSQNIYIKVFYGISSNNFVSHCTPLISNETHSHLRRRYPNIKIAEWSWNLLPAYIIKRIFNHTMSRKFYSKILIYMKNRFSLLKVTFIKLASVSWFMDGSINTEGEEKKRRLHGY